MRAAQMNAASLLLGCLGLALLPSCSVFGVNGEPADVQGGGEGEEGEAGEAAGASAGDGSVDSDSGTESLSTSSTMGAESDDDGGTFVGEGGSEDSDLPQDECGPYCSVSEPGDCREGEKCTVVGCSPGSGWDSTRCRPLYGEGEHLDACTNITGSEVDGHDDCATGHYCMDGECRAFCDWDEPACPEGSACAYMGSGFPGMCFAACDPLDPSSCSPEGVCMPGLFGDGFLCAADASGDEGQYGDTCANLNACDPGLICSHVNDSVPVGCPDGEACCTPYCSLSASNGCPGAAGGEVCVPLFEAGKAPPVGEDVGVCALP